ncbi:MAG: hypothetical protein AAGG80_04875, partial [Pseudomonadota bacterium]
NDNPHQESYLRMLGVAGSIELELKLFQPLLETHQFQKLKPFISLLNAYFAFETLSDNLAVGLARCKTPTPFQQMQKQIILAFNQKMLKKILSNTNSAGELLTKERNKIAHISLNHQSLAPRQMQIFIDDYEKNYAVKHSDEFEYSFFNILILNISTCLMLLDSLKTSPLYLSLKHSLMRRYISVSKIIDHSQQATRVELAAWGRDSILVVPTYMHCIGALDLVEPNPNFSQSINNGLLNAAMQDGALCTRLLNDIGTHLLKADASQRQELFTCWRNIIPKNTQDVFTKIQHLAEHPDYHECLSRIRKDLNHGEFNVCLDNLASQSTSENNLEIFFKNIDYYADLYQAIRHKLHNNLTYLNDLLDNDQISTIIGNFVKFHEYKYSFDYESMQGEYAITNNQ